MKILILSNLVSYTYNFRKELIDALTEGGHQVVVVCEDDDKEKSMNLGCKMIDVPFDGKGTNLKKEISLIGIYSKIIKDEQPDAVLTFTIKMNLYGGLICRLRKIPYYPMITGLGELENKSKIRIFLLMLHKIVMAKASCIFFQNRSNRDYFEQNNIKYKKAVIVPGSGINLQKFQACPYPDENPLSFAFIGRLTKAKGIEQYLQAAQELKDCGYRFYVAGKCDDEYQKTVDHLSATGIIRYVGIVSDSRQILERVHCLVLPTYHPEGMSNVLLEAGATARPAICTDRPGCREIIDDTVNGLYCKAKDTQNLVCVMQSFASLSHKDKMLMGENARAKVQNRFDRKIVVNEYLKELGC